MDSSELAAILLPLPALGAWGLFEDWRRRRERTERDRPIAIPNDTGHRTSDLAGASSQSEVLVARPTPRHRAPVKAVRSFVNLELHKSRAESQDRDSGLWWLFGFPDEKASARAESGTTIFSAFGQSGAAPPPERYSVEDPFDYYWMRAVYSQTNDLPGSYGGVSGGGLWQTVIREDGGKLRIKDRVLRGVAFYETAKTGDSRSIKCHGDRSIYFWLLDQIERKYAP